MEQEILEILKELTEAPSISDTEQEQLAADYLEKRLKEQEYFKKEPLLTGSFAIEGDYLNRSAVYGLVKGKGNKTLILTGHYDVVGVEEYGKFREKAFLPDQLLEEIRTWGKENGYDGEALADAASGEWIFGRGTADMKGGLAIGLAVLNEYGKQMISERKDGNLLFLAVPDEESYSTGMRGAAVLLEELKKRYHLEYECLIDLEPNFVVDGAQEVFVGSVGKCMPAVLVQGAKAHVGSCFQGLSAAGVLGEIFSRTELSCDFADSYDGEICMPPTWLQIRDMKEEYDVSVPYRAGGYLNMLSFSMTPEEVMEKLIQKTEEAVGYYQKKMEYLWEQLQEKKQEDSRENSQQHAASVLKYGSERCHGAEIKVEVMKYEELTALCRQKGGEKFEAYYNKLYKETEEKIRCGQWNYPQATLEMMKKVLDYSGIGDPIVLLGFTPPYYPAFHSDMLGKGTKAGSQWYDALEQAGKEAFGRVLRKKHYFTGISDMSYCGIRQGGNAMDFYGVNAPLWGKLYQIDFDRIEGLNIPSLLFGPLSKDIHQRTERVNRKSLTREVPEILLKLIEQMFAK